MKQKRVCVLCGDLADYIKVNGFQIIGCACAKCGTFIPDGVGNSQAIAINRYLEKLDGVVKAAHSLFEKKKRNYAPAGWTELELALNNLETDETTD